MKKLLLAILVAAIWLCPVSLAANVDIDLSGYTVAELESLIEQSQVEIAKRGALRSPSEVFAHMYDALEKPLVDHIFFKRMCEKTDEPRPYDTSMPGIMWYPLSGRLGYVYSDGWHRLDMRGGDPFTPEHARTYISCFMHSVLAKPESYAFNPLLGKLLTDAVVSAPGDRQTTTASENDCVFTLVRTVNDSGDLRYEFTVAQSPAS